MVTLKQLMTCREKNKKTKKQKKILQGFPQKKAICLKVYTMNPKKPNSAERKVAKIKFSDGKTTIAYIPGEGHSLQQHSIVLVEGGRIKDLPGIKYKFIRGILDFV
uniref:Ribosomal protein S12 n=1 Tax=Symphyocladia marchantioides TaxID=88360 RepID=UPI0022FD4009|nr:Ribosomal protein S12 [Symphyocladia marchantioides]WAX04062.1 Ribosomal protein S12 [Symphyocladia marchantioides]